MSKELSFKEKCNCDKEFYVELTDWFSDWLNDLDKPTLLKYYNTTMALCNYSDDILYKNTKENINTFFKDPYSVLVEVSNSDNYSINEMYFKIGDLESFVDIPYDDYLDEILEKMIDEPSKYGVNIQEEYELEN